MDMNKNTVKYLQNASFSSLLFAEKSEMESLGRDTLDLVISRASSSRNQIYSRKFNSSIIISIKGCMAVLKKSLFYFLCLLFRNDMTWTKAGVNNLKHLDEKAKKT